MSKTIESITPEIRSWIQKQKMFFVATAPLSAEGHVNCSPKGLDSFRVINDHTVAYQDLTGSGIETASHLQENGRIVIMFCAFDGPPRILRFHGRGEVITPAHPEFAQLSLHFTPRRGTRAFIRIHITRIANSCGYSIPLMDFKADRDVLDKWMERKSDDEIREYQENKNSLSIDGLKGI